MVDKESLHKRQDKDTGLNAIWGAFPDLDPDEVMKYRNEERDNLLDAERYRKIKRLVGEVEKITVMRNAKGFSISSIDIRDTVSRRQYDTLDQAVDEVVE